MCGRFTLNKDGKALARAFPAFLTDGEIRPRFNIAPSQPLVCLLNDGSRRMTFSQWGLVPHWAKDPAMGAKMINARAESVFEKPSFRTPIKRKRCLILADGYYEWRRVPGRTIKQPMYFRMRDGRAFAFAGLWDEWHDREGGLLLTSAIITCAPNALAAGVHPRMPVILGAEQWEMWLSNEVDKPAVLKPMMQPYAGGDLEVFAVSRRVNSTRYDDGKCIERVGQMEMF